MDTLEAIATRRSVRQYTDRAVPKELIEKVIAAGLQAPSSMGQQKAIIVAVTNKDLIHRLSKMNAAIGGFTMIPFMALLYASSYWHRKSTERLHMTAVLSWKISCWPLMPWDLVAAGFIGRKKNLNQTKEKKSSATSVFLTGMKALAIAFWATVPVKHRRLRL